MRFVGGSLLALFLLAGRQIEQPVPVGEEPRHHVMFANQFVRVIDAVIPPGDTTLFHTHSRDNVPVAITGGRMKTEVLGGAVTESTVEAGGIWFAKAAYTHRITNLGATGLHFIDAEIVSNPGTGSLSARLDNVPGLRLEIDNERVRVYRIRLAPGESTGTHGHTLSRLDVALGPGRIETDANGVKEIEDLTPGQFHWLPGGVEHAVENVGDSTFEGFLIEWK